MTLAIDITHALRTRTELSSLVEAIRDAGPSEHETDWVEWKRELNLGAEAGHTFEAARHILGFGNRDPVTAVSYCEGTAYLVLGAEPGAVPGVPTWDPADIDNWISKYVAPGAPRWRSDAVVVDGKHIVVITVEAPVTGDRICTLRHGYDRCPAGRVFVRRGGKTEEALPLEIARLEDRLVQGDADIELGLQTEVVGDSLQALRLPEEAFELWRQSESDDLLGSLPAPKARNDRFSFPAPTVNLDPRSTAEFRAEVDAYLERSEQRWLAIAHRKAIEARLAVVQLTIVNPGHRNFPGTQLELSLPPGVLGFIDERDPDDLFQPPERPERYGSYPLLATIDVPTVFARDSEEFVYSNSGGVVRFLPVEVRPGRRHKLPELHLGIPAEMTGETLPMTWRATSTGATSWARGSFELPVARLSAALTKAGGGTDECDT